MIGLNLRAGWVLAMLLAGAGAVIGLLYGLFGVGSAFATPLLALLRSSPAASACLAA